MKAFYFNSRYGERRADPGIADFTFGNPHEMPLDGIVQAIREGARGYLRKDVTLAELVTAVETLPAGGTHLQPALTAALLEGARAHPLPSAPEPVLVEPLTPRETEVLRLMAAAYTNREIAAALRTAEGTAKIHVSNVLAKLDARDRTQAVLRALEMRIL